MKESQQEVTSVERDFRELREVAEKMVRNLSIHYRIFQYDDFKAWIDNDIQSDRFASYAKISFDSCPICLAPGYSITFLEALES